MADPTMLQKLRAQRAVDVRRAGVELQDGLYELKSFDPNKEYCDPTRDRWIGSIGKNVFDGRIVAAVDARFSSNPNWDCLFLR